MGKSIIPKRITFITTVDHNVGDDFVREGLKYIIEECFGQKKMNFTNIHKHSPITSRYGFENIRELSDSEKWDEKLPIKSFLIPDRIKSADLVIQSGAPVYWCHPNNGCHQNEWYEPLVKKRWIPLHKKGAKLINLAGGSCQTYYSDGSEFFDYPEVIDYIKEFYNVSSLTTLRDTLSQNILKKIGLSAPVIPCSSIFAREYHKTNPSEREYVVLNYMSGGGHFMFDQDIDVKKWENTFKEFYQRISQKENVVCVCHNQKEVDEITQILPQAKKFFSRSYLDYIKFYSKAKFGVVNRVHGGFLIGSYGRPALIIGSDTRARMSSEIGLTNYYVNDINIDILMEEYNKLSKGNDNFVKRFELIKSKAKQDYMESLRSIF